MTASPIKIAVAGTGYFSQFHFDAWSRCPEVDVVAVCSLDSETRKGLAEQFEISEQFESVETMLNTACPDVLDIITPPATHLGLIRMAVDRDIHVVCQKPFCGTLKSAEEAVALSKAATSFVCVHENFRFQPWYQALRDELDSDRLGQVYQATFRLRPGDGQGADAYLARQPYFRQMERFLVHETAVHYVDVFRYLFGEVSAVWADLKQLNPVISGEDKGVILMDMEAGMQTLIDANRLSDHAAENTRRTMGEMIIEGEKGVLTLNGNAEISFRSHGDNSFATLDYDWNDHGFGGDCVYRFTRHVVDHILCDTPLVNVASDYLNNLRIEDAIYESSKGGRRLSL